VHPIRLFVVKGKGLEGEPLAMSKENEVLSVVFDCWQELERLHQSAAALKDACATNERFLTGAVARSSWASGAADAPYPNSQSWRQKAEQARDLAYRVTVAKAKPGLLEIADTYDRLQD
jgi:hypothetical protein